jgi:hypothetical protein
MPIIGLTNQQAQFPEIGQLRKGAEKPTNGIGQDLTYFRFTSDIPEVQAAFEAVYDGEPRMVNVLLPFQMPDENWEAWQEEYTAGGLVHRCDGETCVLWLTEDGSYSREPKPCPGGCKPVGRLKVVIPELRQLAYVTVLTGSIHDIRNLDSQLRALFSLRQDLRGIPLQLRRRPKKISTPSGTSGKRARREKWLLSIEAAPQWVHLQLQAQEAAAVPQIPEHIPFTDVPPIDPVTGEILDDEDDWDDVLFDQNGDEGLEPPPDFMLVEIPTGEHAGKTLGRLLEEDPDYLRLVAGGARDKNIRESAQAVLEWSEKLQDELPL